MKQALEAKKISHNLNGNLYNFSLSHVFMEVTEPVLLMDCHFLTSTMLSFVLNDNYYNYKNVLLHRTKT